MYIPDEIKDTILATAELTDIIGNLTALKQKGSQYVCNCPNCGKESGLQVNKKKQIYKCFSCDYKGNSPAQFVMDFKKNTFPEALQYLADYYNIEISDTKKPKGPQKRADKPAIETFRDKQLKSSGIPEEAQIALVKIDGDTEKKVDIFEAGTRDQYGKITHGDDMIIWYFDLEGKPIQYKKANTEKLIDLYRIRWQNPAMHCDKNNRPMKYSSPVGSGSHLFIPEQVRKAYKEGRVIKRLYIQEGEKKTVKANLHGMFSVGIMGIMNIAYNGQLPYEFELLIKACQIEEVIFMVDADWDDLSNDLNVGDQVDQRPRNFFYAVRNFREHFKKFTNIGIYLELYFGHVQKNEQNDKGIDDLLNNTLKGKETDLIHDLESAFHEKSGTGKYIQLHKISTVSELKLQELWGIQKAEVFADKYKDELINLKEFKIGKHKWRFDDDGKFIPAQALQEDEEYYEKEIRHRKDGTTYPEFKFRYRRCYNFLANRGYGRYDTKSGKFIFIKHENKIVEEVDSYHMRDFVMEFTEQIAEKVHLDDIMDTFYRGAKMYLGPDSLSNLKYQWPLFQKDEKGSKTLYFRSKSWKITSEKITEGSLADIQNSIWKEQINDFDAKLLPDDFIIVKRYEQADINAMPDTPFDKNILLHQFDIKLSPEAEKCHFLRFLYNAGEFAWRKQFDPITRRAYSQAELNRMEDKYSVADKMETNMHFVSKMTAIGYLLHKYRDKSCEKAVIAMDGQMSEVGESNGRSGKSLLGYALGQVIPQCYIGAKSKNLTDDPFIWEEVTEKTQNIFLDDVRANIDFEFFFPVITGKITINVKGAKKFTLSEDDTPKIYLTTNHSINGDSGSHKDRKFELAFSDYYNAFHKPIDDFGFNFFSEWDETQRNLFFNFMARCQQLYFYAQAHGWGVSGSGLVQGPIERLELRAYRQFMGEVFLTWADEYFGMGDDIDQDEVSNNNINRRIPRSELYGDFMEHNKTQLKFVNPHRFKKDVIAYCKYRQLRFNPHKGMKEGKPIDDKSGGVEYFTIANAKYSTPEELKF